MELYRQDMDNKIAENDSSIKMLYEKQMKKGNAKLKSEIAKLEEENNKLKMKMNEAKVDSKEKWDEFKTEFNHDMDGLGKALNDLGKNNK